MKLGAGGVVSVGWEGPRRTEGGIVAADLTVSEAGAAVKYNVYLLKDGILLQFQSTDRSRVELAVRLLKLAGVGAEVKKVDGKRDVWRVTATTDKLAAGREEVRKALAEIVRKAVENGWVNTNTAERWLEKLEEGRVLREGWPKYLVRLKEGALMVRFGSTNLNSVEEEARRFREMGLVEGVHFTVKMPEGGGSDGYVSILKEGLAFAAWLSVHGSGEQRRLAEDFISYILERAKEEGEDVYRKALEVVEEGRSRGSLTLKGLEKKVEVNSREHVVKVIGGGAELEESWSNKKLLRLTITAEVDGVRSDYTITYGRYGRNNAAVGFATAKADAPGGREADVERFSALIKALTGKEPRIHKRSNGAVELVCGKEHLNGFMRYAELADAIEKWLKETSWRA
jgi:Fe2+ transport system protein FeoA